MDDSPSKRKKLIANVSEKYSSTVAQVRGAHGTEAVFLEDLSNPPTAEELRRYVDLPAQELPHKYRREMQYRVYSNREIRLDLVKWYGFDMDYTLAQYNSPEYEILSFDLVKERLLKIGYPAEIAALKYEADFAVRGLFVDRKLGNLLKVDTFGTIISGVHGRRRLVRPDIEQIYPSLMIHQDDIGKRFYLLDTLFALPMACLLCSLIDLLEATFGAGADGVGQKDSALSVTYVNLFDDVQGAVDWVHQQGELKKRTLEDMPRYVKRDARLNHMLQRLHECGSKVFLLTNSDWSYTDPLMAYLLANPESPSQRSWRDYFDIVIVDARKPLFFGGGTALREVDTITGMNRLAAVTEFRPGSVYRGGNLEIFSRLTGAQGHQVLYVGDHIFGDIIKSKKTLGWRTLLVIPELHHELTIWASCQQLYNHLVNLEFMRAEIYRGLDAEATEQPDITELRTHMRATSEAIDARYNTAFGSLFRSGSKKSFFSMQVQRYADLYSADCTNLLSYPWFYHFRPESTPMPHETDVAEPLFPR